MEATRQISTQHPSVAFSHTVGKNAAPGLAGRTSAPPLKVSKPADKFQQQADADAGNDMHEKTDHPVINRSGDFSPFSPSPANQKNGSGKEYKSQTKEEDSHDTQGSIGGDKALKPAEPETKNGKEGGPVKGRSAETVMDDDPAFKGIVKKVKDTGKKAKTHEPSGKKAKEAQSAALPPANEKLSKAKDQKVAEMDQQEAGTFDENKFKAALRAKIAALQLNTLKEAENFKANNGAAAVKGDAASQVSNEKNKASGSIEGKVKEAPAPGNIKGKEVGPAPKAAPNIAAPALSGAQASPKPVPPGEVSLQKGSQDLDKQMTDAKVTEKQLAKSNEPKFTDALASKKTAQKDAVDRPPQFRKDEKGIINNAQLVATGLSKTKLASLVGSRKQKMGGVLSKQQEAKAKDEADRAKVAADIEAKYAETKTDVEGLLSKLETDVTAMFDQGINDATRNFEDYVDREVHRFKVDRYLNRFGGSLLWAKDLLLGLPDEVNDIYARGKDLYVKDMDVVIDKVAKLVAAQLNAAKKRIGKGKQEIQSYVESLPKNLQKIGADAAKNIQSKFSELQQSINEKQNDLVDSLAAKYKAGLENVNKKIAEMKEANKGLVSKAIGAIKAVINAIIEFKNLLLNVLAKAAAAIELIIDDPIGFLGNLVAGVKQGIQGFMSRIGEHLKAGLMGWLFGTLASAGIEIPKSFDLRGIITLILSVLGLTYANIRSRAVNIVGEKVVAGLEKAAEIFIIIKNEGIGGLWKYIKDKVESLKETVLTSIKEFVIQKIVVAGITWLISLLNPASAFIKACKMIYDVVMFFITRGKQILDLVNAIIDSITAIAKGAINVAANAVENALAKAIPVALGFLASLLGLDGISEKIKAIIAKIQAPVNAVIDWVIKQAVGLVKGIAGLFGVGKDKKDERTMEEKETDLVKAQAEAEALLFSNATLPEIEKQLPAIKNKYKLSIIKIEPLSDNEFDIYLEINPGKKTKKKKFDPANLKKDDYIRVKAFKYSDTNIPKEYWPVCIVTELMEKDKTFRFKSVMGKERIGLLNLSDHETKWKKSDKGASALSQEEFLELNFKENGAFEVSWADSKTATKVLNWRVHETSFNPSGKEWEHILEQSLGGPHTVANLALANGKINNELGKYFGQRHEGVRGRGLENTGALSLREYLKAKNDHELSIKWKKFYYEVVYKVSVQPRNSEKNLGPYQVLE